MELQTPYEYMFNLKQTLVKEHEGLVENKKLQLNAGNIEMAVIYRDLEKKLLAFMKELGIKQDS